MVMSINAEIIFEKIPAAVHDKKYSINQEQKANSSA